MELPERLIQYLEFRIITTPDVYIAYRHTYIYSITKIKDKFPELQIKQTTYFP